MTVDIGCPDGATNDPIRCGVDVVSIGRIDRLLTEFGDSFRARVCTPTERRYCDSQGDPPQHYAARWAVKEAFQKAVGGSPSVPLTSVSVRRDGDGPVLVLSAAAREAAATALGVGGATDRVGTAVSLSHDRQADCATGQVLVFDRGRLGPTGGREGRR